MIESFDTDDFERTLREEINNFELEPSKKVWKSIYNELHPGSKWPSLAVGIVMLIGIFWIGNRNYNSENNTKTTQINIKKDNLNSPSDQKVSPSIKDLREENAITPGNSELFSKMENSGSLVAQELQKRDLNSISPAPDKKKALTSFNQLSIEQTLIEGNLNTPDKWYFDKLPDIPATGITGIANSRIKGKASSSDEIYKVIYPKQDINGIKFTEDPNSPTPGLIRSKTNLKAAIIGVPQRMDESLVPFKGTSMKKVNKIRKAEWTFFVAPEISNVLFKGSALNQSPSRVVVNPVSYHRMDRSPHLGFQVGTHVAYKLNSFMHIFTGLQMNYEGYNMEAKIVHPTLATVTFKGDRGEMITRNYVTYLSNKPGEGNTVIKNYSLQMGIPVGLELVLTDNGHTSWIVSSDIEPFAVVSGMNYILSGDGENFVYDQDIIRRLNLNGGLGTHVILTGKNIKWQIGPTFRYQILSTYQNLYSVKEHLFSYGLRLGISKKN